MYEQYSRQRDDEDFEEDENEDELTPQERYKQALDKVKASGNAAAPLDHSKWENDFSDSDDSEGFAEERRRIAKSFGRHRCVHNIWLVYAGVTENDAADEPTRACSSRLGSGKFDATRNETCGRTSKGKGKKRGRIYRRGRKTLVLFNICAYMYHTT